MNKLYLNQIVIKNSDKQIALSIPYELKEGFNIICGNNEAGKSSIMNFIKNGFQKEKTSESGMIRFTITDDNSSQKKYNAVINGILKKDKRLIITDENNQDVTELLLNKHFDRKYFNHGFMINLDNLSDLAISSNESLKNTIKDPSGNNLNEQLEIIQNASKKIFNDKNKLSVEVNNLLKDIENKNSEINQLSLKEGEYNDIINSIYSVNEELCLIQKKEEILNNKKELNKLKEELDIKTEEYEKLTLNYNDQILINKSEYLQIISSINDYNHNCNYQNKLNEKIEELNNKTDENISHLNYDFHVNLTETEIKNFVINYENINKIKELSKEKKEIENKIKTNEILKKDFEEKLSAYVYKIEKIKENQEQSNNIQELKTVFKSLDEGLKQYNYILNELSGDKEFLNTGERKILLIILFVFFILSGIITWLNISQNNILEGIISLICSIISVIYAFITLTSKSNEAYKKNLYKNKILEDLKKIALTYNKELENYQTYNIVPKLEYIKYELETIINNHEEKIFYENKLYELNNSDNESELSIKNIENTITEIINLDNKNCSIASSIYPEIIEQIKYIQENLKETTKYQNEIEKYNNDNIIIKERIFKYINEKNINIPVNENIESLKEELEKYYENNIKIKEKADIIQYEINQIKNKTEEIKNKLPNTEEQIQINEEEELSIEKKNKTEQKTNLEIAKSKLEDFEGLNKLKLEKYIKLEEYRKKISELFQNQMILEISEKAKSNFNKTQPDLINAQKYLNILTGGKYIKINIDTEEIETQTGITKKWEELSRGTKEQLYLSLRLGYASNYSKNRITQLPNGRANLPIIIDDAFVNFDPSRSQNAINCLAEFSKTNQVIFFTCHEETYIKYLSNCNVNIINI